MDSDQIKTFIAVVKFKSFSKAAEALILTQPAVSSRIQNLEKELGCQLFIREGRSFTLSEEGELFVKHANKILGQLHSVKDEINILKKPNLKVGFSPIVSSLLILETLKYFDFKQTYISIRKGRGTSELIQLVLNNELHLAFITKAIVHPDLAIETVSSYKLVFVISPTHRLAKQTTITKDMLHGENLICYRRDAQSWAYVEEKLQDVELNHIEIQDLETLKDLVIDGWGFAILPSYAIGKNMNRLLIKDFPEINKINQLHALFKKDKMSNEHIQKFINAVKMQF